MDAVYSHTTKLYDVFTVGLTNGKGRPDFRDGNIHGNIHLPRKAGNVAGTVSFQLAVRDSDRVGLGGEAVPAPAVTEVTQLTSKQRKIFKAAAQGTPEDWTAALKALQASQAVA